MVSQLRKGRFATSALWKLIQSPTRVPLELKQLASNLLLELLHTAEFQSDRTLVCGRCIENIARFSSVAQSLDLLTRIINTFPEKKAWKKVDTKENLFSNSFFFFKKKKQDSKRSIIELLDNQYQLIAKTFAYVEERTRRFVSQSLNFSDKEFLCVPEFERKKTCRSQTAQTSLLWNKGPCSCFWSTSCRIRPCRSIVTKPNCKLTILLWFIYSNVSTAFGKTSLTM